MWVALALSVAVVAYNNLINRWEPFHAAAYVPINLMFAGALTAIAAAMLHLSGGELGLRGHARDVLLPLVLVMSVALGAFGLAASRYAHRIADKRVAGMQGSAVAFYVLVRIPLGTAVTEELIFRGVLFAAWRDAGTSDVVAAVCASVAFGLWHISPTVIGLRINDPDASHRKVRAAVVGVVLFTTVAGLGLTWLRVEAGGLVGPIAVHAGINSVGALAAAAAGRRGEREGPSPSRP